MPFSSIDPENTLPVYEQIKNLVRFSILSEEYGPGDQLPSVVGLSETLKVNLNTVAKAYRDLEVQKVIYTRRGSGCYVAQNATRVCAQQTRHEVLSRLFQAVSEAQAAGLSESELTSYAQRAYQMGAAPYATPPKKFFK